jgi:Domain of unknown function (DUF4177)
VQGGGEALQEWEYRTFYIRVEALNNNTQPLETALNQQGSSGWELVSVTAQPNHPAGYVAVFKRPKHWRR